MSRPLTYRIDAYAAMSSPIRRRLLDLLGDGERSVGAINEELSMTLPALSQHLRVLRRAKLVRQRQVGSRRLYRVNAQPLHAVQRWLVRHTQS